MIYMAVSDLFVKNIEVEYLRLLASLLRNGKINRQYAQDSAKEFLALLPFTTPDDIHDKIKSYTEKFESLIPLHAYVVNEIDKNQTHTVLEKMRSLIKNNEIDEAVTLIQS